MRLLNASGCLDALAAPEVARSFDAFVTKTVTPLPREGNAPARIAETDAGMLNAIGVSVGGFSSSDYEAMCGAIDGRGEVAVVEVNLACPNGDEVPANVAEV